jgi:hypothetical protein
MTKRASVTSLHKKDPINDFNADENEPRAIKLTAFAKNNTSVNPSNRKVLKKSPTIDLAEISVS